MHEPEFEGLWQDQGDRVGNAHSKRNTTEVDGGAWHPNPSQRPAALRAGRQSLATRRRRYEGVPPSMTSNSYTWWERVRRGARVLRRPRRRVRANPGGKTGPRP